MFNERFDLIMRDDHKSYSLAGTHDQKKWTEIKDPKVLGVITPAIVSLFITEELRKKDPENFQKTMQYWRSRYKGTRSELRQEMSGFTYLGIRLKEIKENSEIVESIHWITEI